MERMENIRLEGMEGMEGERKRRTKTTEKSGTLQAKRPPPHTISV